MNTEANKNEVPTASGYGPKGGDHFQAPEVLKAWPYPAKESPQHLG